ncbi:MAG: septum formation initiator family protein [Chloroflexota bacterium]|nr:septum formation initiator family protein [Chloroflexota bacterium]
MSRLPRLPIMPVVAFAAALAIGSLTYTTTRYFIHNYQLHQDEAQIRRDIAGLDSDHQRLLAVRDYLSSDEYIEDIARRTLGLVRPGETLVVVSGNGASPTTEPLAQHTPGAGWWKGLFPAPQPAPAP